MLVHLKVTSFVDHLNGTLTVEVPDRPITDEEARVLDKLFPHCDAQISELLNTEALIGSQVDSRETQAKTDSVQRQQYPTKRHDTSDNYVKAPKPKM